MTFTEIQDKIYELELSVEILEDLRNKAMHGDESVDVVNALSNGLRYTRERLDKYKTTDWIMALDT